jgi:hypothetical protein
MPVPGLNPNIRLVPEAPDVVATEDVEVLLDDGSNGDDTPDVDDAGNILSIKHPDGSISISLDGSPLGKVNGEQRDLGFYKNLAEEIDEMELSRIADDLMRGINADLETRKDWIEDRAQGLKLLGLKIEIPGLQGAADGAPVEGMSRIRHPLLLEACLRFQANARSELLPTDGPVKIREDNASTTTEEDKLADALEKDMNHYLTSTASEYYPDTDRMLLMLGFGGSSFKKVYFCPLRNRPVSESVDADDLIVNNQATDLENAKRVTHRIMMRPSVVKRMQIIGAYRDIPLHSPKQRDADAVTDAKAAQQGIDPTVNVAEDRDREIYECYCELDVAGFEHTIKGEATGLELPYRVTIDVSSRQILSIIRNYDEDDDELPTARKTFVKYTFVPGLGFYDIGLLHILGNTTNAVTAAWRELLDAGMYANFPGFLYSDQGARQNSNIFRVPPGGGAPIKTGGMAINQAIMPLPYKEPSSALMTLAQNIGEYGQRVGGTAELAVGEGRQDAPVGTTLAMIEQATKVLNAVHKRMHAAQSEEFQLLIECFRDHPESFWQRNKRPSYQWDEATFREALNNYYLVPQADPNTASHTQRLMKVSALVQMAGAVPQLFNQREVAQQAIMSIGYGNPERFLANPNAPPPMDPRVIQAQSKAQSDAAMSQARMMDAQSNVARTQADVMKTQAEVNQMQNGEGNGTGKQVDTPVDIALAHAKLLDAQAKHKKNNLDAASKMMDHHHKNEDRNADILKAAAGHAREAAKVRNENEQSDIDRQMELMKPPPGGLTPR